VSFGEVDDMPRREAFFNTIRQAEAGESYAEKKGVPDKGNKKG